MIEKDAPLIKAVRNKTDGDLVVSRVSVSGLYACDGVEDVYRAWKEFGVTRIPAGVYELAVNNSGGEHNKWSRVFSKFHEGCIEIRKVPGIANMLILPGGEGDTDKLGFLVGVAELTPSGFRLCEARAAYESFYKRVIRHVTSRKCYIEFIDESPKNAKGDAGEQFYNY